MHVDFLALSFPQVEIRSLDESAHFGSSLFGHRWQDALENLPREFYRVPALAPFNAAIHTPLGTISWKSHGKGAHVQLTGKQCQAMDEAWMLHALANWKCTRIDIAHDIHIGERAISPATITAQHTAKSQQVAQSATGYTVYLGSPKSDTMTRVYEYFLPHPRAGSVRVEHQFRRKMAQEVARLVVLGKMEDVYATRVRALNLIGADEAIEGVERVRIAGAVVSNDDGKRVSWLIKSVRPALNRALRDGLLSLDDIIDAENIIRYVGGNGA